LSRQSLLAGAKATAILSEYNDGAIAAISFRIATEFGVLTFRLPANLEGAYAILMRSKQIPRSLRNHAQARRVAWRSVLHWLDSQLALIQAGLASLDQLFLPFAQDSAGVNPIRADTRGKVLRAAFRAGQGELTELIGAARIPSLGELLLNLFPAEKAPPRISSGRRPAARFPATLFPAKPLHRLWNEGRRARRVGQRKRERQTKESLPARANHDSGACFSND
jgi:hypothetical protein